MQTLLKFYKIIVIISQDFPYISEMHNSEIPDLNETDYPDLEDPSVWQPVSGSNS